MGRKYLRFQESLGKRFVECVQLKRSEKRAINCFFRLLKSRALWGFPTRIGKAWIGGLACSELAESKRVERGETVHGAQVSSC